jgi:spermidine synthase
MVFSLLVLGFISIWGQVVLLRELNIAFFGVELIYLLALGIWLVGTAVGSLAGPIVSRINAASVGFLFLLLSLLLPVHVVLCRSIRILPFPFQIASLLLILLPVALVLGILFQWICRLYLAPHLLLARAYSIECIGGILGGIGSTLALKWGMQNWPQALMGAGLCLFSAWWLSGSRSRVFSRGLAVLGFVLIVLLWAKAPAWDWQMTAWNHPDLLDCADTPYGRIAITKLAGQISVYENDVLWFESEGFDAESFVYLATLQRPSVRRVLLLGGGVEGLVRDLLAHRPTRVDYVEINPRLLELAEPHLPRSIQESLRDDRVRIFHADPRQFLQKAGQYDLILVAMAEPVSGQANRFFTREFFGECASRLTADGVLCFRLRSLENRWTPPIALRASSIYGALANTFPHARILPGNTNYLLASRQPLPAEPAILIDRMKERKLAPQMMTPPYIEYLYTNDRVAEIVQTLHHTPAPVNSDSEPVVYQYTTLLWLSKFFPALLFHNPYSAEGKSPGFSSFPWLLLTQIPILFLICRLFSRVRRVLLVAVAGFAGMVLETLLILYYQTRNGVLYQDLGILLTCFMGGLAAGAWLYQRWATVPSRSSRSLQRAGIYLMGGFSAFLLGVTAFIAFNGPAGILWTGAGLLGAGTWVAAIFACASFRNHPGETQWISPYYAADLAGGAIGCLLSSLILIPSWGLKASAFWTGILCVFALLLS